METGPGRSVDSMGIGTDCGQASLSVHSEQFPARGGGVAGGGQPGRGEQQQNLPHQRAGPGRAGAAVLWRPRVHRVPRAPSVGQEVGACAEEPGSSWLWGAQPAWRPCGLPGERPGFSRPSLTPAAPQEKELRTSEHLGGVRNIQCEKPRGCGCGRPAKGPTPGAAACSAEPAGGGIGRSPTPRPSHPVRGQSAPGLLPPSQPAPHSPPLPSSGAAGKGFIVPL